MSARARRSPIHVEKGSTWKGEVVWIWSCDVHVRARGYHHRNRRVDRWLRRMGKPPAPHPWVRCMGGANRHWHDYHAACKCAVTPDPDMSLKPRAETEPTPQIGHAL